MAAKAKGRLPSKVVVFGGGIAALLVLGGGGFYAWTTFFAPPPPPIVARPKPAAAAPAAAVPVTSSVATKPAAALTPSDTLNAVAAAPVNAINKAQDALAARRASGQAGVDAVIAGQDASDNRPTNATVPVTQAQAAATLAPGITATSSEVQAMAEATPAFRSFVANGKVTGVIGGSPAKIILNGRLARTGDIVEPALGITFDGLDADRKLLVFKDKTGAVVTRKF